MPQLGNVPTFGEAGGAALRGMGSYTFFGLLGPAGMPEPIVQALNEALNKVAVKPDVDQALRERLLYRPVTATPAAFRAYLEREITKWRELGEKANIVIQ
jgi:tripartite-type tricarboxylate transporter receptor subunit TctC